MATANATTREVEVTLTLTEDEAHTILAALNPVSGAPTSNSVFVALYAALGHPEVKYHVEDNQGCAPSVLFLRTRYQ